MKLFFVVLLSLLATPAVARICKTAAGKALNMSDGSATESLTGKVTCTYSDGERLILDYKAGNVVTEEKWQGKSLLLRSHFSYPNKNSDGKWEEWYPNGKPKSIEHYAKGTQQGEAISYHEDGGLESKGYYVNGNQVASIRYHPNGLVSTASCKPEPALAKAPTYAQLCGYGKASQIPTYYSDKKKKHILTYQDGKLIATTDFDDAGKVTATEKMAVAGKDGIETSWHPNGKKKQEVRYDKDKRLHGKQREYDTSGKLVRDATFNKGFMTSEKIYYLNGQPKRITTQKKQDQTTLVVAKHFHDNGKVEQSGTYVEKRAFDTFFFGLYWDYSYLAPIGKHYTHRADGTLFSTAQYKDGDPHGRTVYYHPDGKTKKTELVYEDGHVQRKKTYKKSGALISDEEFFKDGSSKKYKVAH